MEIKTLTFNIEGQEAPVVKNVVEVAGTIISIGAVDSAGRKRYAEVELNNGETVDALLWEGSFTKFPEKYGAGLPTTVQVCVDEGDYKGTCQLTLPKVRRATGLLAKLNVTAKTATETA